MGVLPACISMVVSGKPGGGTISPETGVTYSCDLLCRCYGTKQTLGEQSVLLTIEPSLNIVFVCLIGWFFFLFYFIFVFVLLLFCLRFVLSGHWLDLQVVKP